MFAVALVMCENPQSMGVLAPRVVLMRKREIRRNLGFCHQISSQRLVLRYAYAQAYVHTLLGAYMQPKFIYTRARTHPHRQVHNQTHTHARAHTRMRTHTHTARGRAGTEHTQRGRRQMSKRILEGLLLQLYMTLSRCTGGRSFMFVPGAVMFLWL